jgi:hypothetical protein
LYGTTTWAGEGPELLLQLPADEPPMTLMHMVSALGTIVPVQGYERSVEETICAPDT